MIKSRIESKSKSIFNRQTVIRKPLPLDVLLMLKARKQAIINIKDIAGLILKLEKDYNIKTMKDIKTEKGLLCRTKQKHETRKRQNRNY